MSGSKWKRLAFDLETNGLFFVPKDERLIWCMGVMDVDSEEYRVFMGDDLLEGIHLLHQAELIIAHNGVGFDIPWIKSMFDIDVGENGVVWDTKIISTLYKPDIGGHRLENWGKRLGYKKMDYRGALIEAGALEPDAPKGAEFGFYHPLMLDYVQRDVEVCAKLFKAELSMGAKDGWGDSYEAQVNNLSFRMEHEAQRIMFEQEQYGWLFNVPKAEHLVHRMEQAVVAIDGMLDELISPIVETKGQPIKPLLKSSTPEKPKYSQTAIKWMGDDVHKCAGEFSRLIIRRPDYNSQAQLKQALIKLGWRATEYTDAGNPRLTESSLIVWGGKTGKAVSRRLMYKHRLGLVNGLLKHVRPDGRVGAGGAAQGAVTGRVTHKVVANIPRYTPPKRDEHGNIIKMNKLTDKLGGLIRALFYCPDDKVLVGCDASGLELRCLAHYVNSDEITREILEGDIHQKNADAVGVDRNTVKTLTYGWLYGAGDAKLGATALDSSLGQWAGTAEEGTTIRAKFLKSMNAETLMKQVAAKAESGSLKGIDGRIIPIRAEHAALNTLLQSAGAIVMKLAYVKLASWLEADPSRGRLLCFYHDEYTVECDPEQANQTGEVMAKCISWAGKKLGFRVPLEGEPAQGSSWKDIH